jgi:hypothetical protein
MSDLLLYLAGGAALSVGGYVAYAYNAAVSGLSKEVPALLLDVSLETPAEEPFPESVVEEISEPEPETEAEVESEPESAEEVLIDWGSVPTVDRVNFHIRRFTMALEQNQDETLTEELSRNLRYWKAVKAAIEIGQG